MNKYMCWNAHTYDEQGSGWYDSGDVLDMHHNENKTAIGTSVITYRAGKGKMDEQRKTALRLVKWLQDNGVTKDYHTYFVEEKPSNSSGKGNWQRDMEIKGAGKGQSVSEPAFGSNPPPPATPIGDGNAASNGDGNANAATDDNASNVAPEGTAANVAPEGTAANVAPEGTASNNDDATDDRAFMTVLKRCVDYQL